MLGLSQIMHGHVGNPNDKKMLLLYIIKERCVSSLFGDYVIKENVLLRDALNRVYVFLVEIEESYCKKERENKWKYTINTKIGDES